MTEAELIQFCPFSLDSLACKLKDKQSRRVFCLFFCKMMGMKGTLERFWQENRTRPTGDLVHDPLRVRLLSAMSSASKEPREVRRKTIVAHYTSSLCTCHQSKYRENSPQTCTSYIQCVLTVESVFIRKEFNSHRIGFIHQHGLRFIVLYTNMAAVSFHANREDG